MKGNFFRAHHHHRRRRKKSHLGFRQRRRRREGPRVPCTNDQVPQRGAELGLPAALGERVAGEVFFFFLEEERGEFSRGEREE